MKDFSYYTNVSVRWPSKPDYRRYNVFLGHKVLGTGLAKDEADVLVQQNKGAEMSSYFLEEDYNAQRKAYTQEETRLHAEFDQDVFEEFGVVGHPKAAKAMSLAWDRGHSEGFDRVYEEFAELVELIK